jgi:hypothetical protein
MLSIIGTYYFDTYNNIPLSLLLYHLYYIHSTTLLLYCIAIPPTALQLASYYNTPLYCHGLSQWWTSDASIEEQKPGQLVVLIRGSKAKEGRRRRRRRRIAPATTIDSQPLTKSLISSDHGSVVTVY